jgi:hypothetical protein
MPATEREIYRSSNGDRWYLVQERGSDRDTFDINQTLHRAGNHR